MLVPAVQPSSAGGSAPPSTTGWRRPATRRGSPPSGRRTAAMAGAAACTSSFVAAEARPAALFLNRCRLIARAGDGHCRPRAQILAMREGTAQKISNALLSGAAGFASFVFSLSAFLYIREWNEQILASVIAGAFCLLICYVASERPNSENARALAALGDRLLAVEDGDLVSPAPPSVRKNMPQLAAAVDTLFSEVRASIENAHALEIGRAHV